MLNKLIKLAEFYGAMAIVTKKKRSEIGGGSLHFQKRLGMPVIIIDDCDEIRQVTLLAHEIGHLVDYRFNHASSSKSFKRVRKFDVLTQEIEAWQMAEEILAGLGFTFWKEFEVYKILGLTSYINGLCLRGNAICY